MALYNEQDMSKKSKNLKLTSIDLSEVHLSKRVAESLQDLVVSAKEGLLALSVSVGLKVFQALMEEEVTEVVGPKGKHNPERKAVRHGYEKGSVVLGGRKVQINRPRTRTLDGQELLLQSYVLFQKEDPLTQIALERMLHGLSSRNYSYGLEPCGKELESKSISKSSISRRFIKLTRTALSELLKRPLDNLDILVLFIDGVVVAEHTITVALGVDAEGYKHILGLAEGATENATVCRELLSDLVERGFNIEKGLLVVIDGSKALHRAVKDVFGNKALIQRCRVHKKKNVLGHLPKAEQGRVSRKLDQAWQERDFCLARLKLENLAKSLEKAYPGAAASIREGLTETLTINKLGIPKVLQTSLKSTNIIESAFDITRNVARNVKRWRNGEHVLRWSAAGLMEAEERFRRIKGYRELPLLRVVLQRELNIDTNKKEVVWA